MEYIAEVNLVVVTYNRLEYTKECIPSIRETASGYIPYIITVVDNGSTDGTQEVLKQYLEKGIIDNLILLKSNMGISRAQNIGWKMFDDIPYYAKIDNDMVFNKEGWLDDIIEIFNKTDKIGALGYQCNDDGAEYPIVSDNGVKYRIKNGNIGGACFFVPKHIKDELGYWNESFGKYGEEDADYGMRVTVGGFRNAYMIDTEVITHLPDEKGDYRDFKDRERDENLKGSFWNIIKEYQNGTRPLKIETRILDELDFIGEVVK